MWSLRPEGRDHPGDAGQAGGEGPPAKTSRRQAPASCPRRISVGRAARGLSGSACNGAWIASRVGGRRAPTAGLPGRSGPRELEAEEGAVSSFRAAQVSTDAGPVLSPRTLARAARFSRRLKESNEREMLFRPKPEGRAGTMSALLH